ncbi:hypothetical protein [Streptomyces sp. NPDC015125]|uniref:hypothetical protein n=1 Tax=Streptomyces sp. NPDC015125 TaxID=3364938 RepID=UPI0036F6AE0F
MDITEVSDQQKERCRARRPQPRAMRLPGLHGQTDLNEDEEETSVTHTDEYATLTVVVKRAGTQGDPCDVLHDEHTDVLFVGHQEGITATALALGGDPSSWL